jgi:Uma2 family endonuclease
MSAVPNLAISRMTVDEFLDWPGDGSGRAFQLVDGEPVAMAPASITHGIIQANLTRLLGTHLLGSRCHVVVAPGVIPRLRSESNIRVPDLAVSCERDDRSLRALVEPVLLVEILSPSNENETRRNVWSYATIPSAREILLINSTRMGAELLRRDANGEWPANPEPVGPDDMLRLASLDWAAPLAALYEGTHLDRNASG